MIKTIIKSCLDYFGIGTYRLKHRAEQELKKTTWLKNIGIKTVLDIGANTGQFAKYIHQIFPDAMIYSFEPLEDCYEELVASLADVAHFQAFNVALGNDSGEIAMHRSEFSASSSLLTMNELHKECFPFTRGEAIEKVSISRLDDIVCDLRIHNPLLIKLDVQGFEDKVIAGGEKVISRADVIIVELSTEELYEHQPLFNDVYTMLVNLGFKYRGNHSQNYNPIDGRVLQVDGIFTKA